MKRLQYRDIDGIKFFDNKEKMYDYAAGNGHGLRLVYQTDVSELGKNRDDARRRAAASIAHTAKVHRSECVLITKEHVIEDRSEWYRRFTGMTTFCSMVTYADMYTTRP